MGLSGPGIDFSISGFRGGTSITVASGQTATYLVTADASPGFNAVVTFSCSGAPAGANCSVNPSALVLAGSVSLQVNVTTTARAAVVATPRRFNPDFNWVVALALLPLFYLSLYLLRDVRRRKVFTLAVLGAALALLISCGGGSGTGGGGGGGGISTPPGTYTLTVTATGLGVTRQTKLTLIVQ